MCDKSKMSKDFIFLECSDAFCSDCLKTDWQGKIKSTGFKEELIRCSICHKTISYEFLKANLDSELFSEYDNKLAQSYISENTEKVVCPQENCLSIHFIDKRLSYVECEKCKLKFCIICYGKWEKHAGFSCEQYKNRQIEEDSRKKIEADKFGSRLHYGEYQKRENNKEISIRAEKIGRGEKSFLIKSMTSDFNNLEEQDKNLEEKKNNSIINFKKNSQEYQFEVRHSNHKNEFIYQQEVFENMRNLYLEGNFSNVKKEVTCQNCEFCGHLLLSHLTHNCGGVLCKEKIIYIIKKMIDIKKIEDVKCDRCNKIIHLYQLKQLISENLYSEYYRNIIGVSINTDIFFFKCYKYYCKYEFYYKKSDSNIICSKCSTMYCRTCKKETCFSYPCCNINSSLNNQILPIKISNIRCFLCSTLYPSTLEESMNGMTLFCRKHNNTICKFCGVVLIPYYFDKHICY